MSVYACQNLKKQKRVIQSFHTRRSKSQGHHQGKSKVSGTVAKRNRAQSRLQKAGHEAILTGRCWLCGNKRADTQVSVACETPAGKPCKPKLVVVHFGCWMDMDD